MSAPIYRLWRYESGLMITSTKNYKWLRNSCLIYLASCIYIIVSSRFKFATICCIGILICDKCSSKYLAWLFYFCPEIQFKCEPTSHQKSYCHVFCKFIVYTSIFNVSTRGTTIVNMFPPVFHSWRVNF